MRARPGPVFFHHEHPAIIQRHVVGFAILESRHQRVRLGNVDLHAFAQHGATHKVGVLNRQRLHARLERCFNDITRHELAELVTAPRPLPASRDPIGEPPGRQLPHQIAPARRTLYGDNSACPPECLKADVMPGS